MDDELSDEENEPKKSSFIGNINTLNENNYYKDKDNHIDQNKNIKSKTNEPFDK